MAGKTGAEGAKSLPVGRENGLATNLVESKAFENGINALIVGSAVLMGLQADLSVRPEFDYLDSVWSGCDMLLALVFFAEMVLKLNAYGFTYFRDQWNWLDFVVSWVSAASVFIVPLAQDVAESSGFGGLDVARVFRLMRLMRMMKMMKAVPELMMVMEGLVASMKSMVWVFMLLLLVLYVMSIYCVEMIGRRDSAAYSHFEQNLTRIKEQSELFQTFNNYESFGNVPRAMLTLFSITLVAEWSEVIRPVFEAQQVHIPIFVLLILLTSFGIVNVIIGVICEKTNESMRRMEQEGIANHHVEQTNMVQTLSSTMFSMDKDGDGSLSREEFSAGGKGHLKEKFDQVQLPLGFTFEDLHTMLDVDGSGDLSHSEFLSGMCRLICGNEFQLACTSQLMMGQIKHNIHLMRTDLDSLRGHVRTLKTSLRTGRDGDSPSGTQNHAAAGTGSGGGDGDAGSAAEPIEDPTGEPRVEQAGDHDGPSLSDWSLNTAAPPRDREALGLAMQQARRDREEAELFLRRIQEERGRVRSEQVELEAERNKSAAAVVRELQEERRSVDEERRLVHEQHQEAMRRLEDVRQDQIKADAQWQRVLREREQLAAAQARLEPVQ